MSEPHVISALKEKRAELAGALQVAERHVLQLQADLAAVDQTILIFDPNAEPEQIRAVIRRPQPRLFRPGTWTRSVLGVLRGAERPLSVREIAALVAVDASLKADTPAALSGLSDKVRNTLSRQREGVLTKGWDGATVVWSVAEEMTEPLPD